MSCKKNAMNLNSYVLQEECNEVELMYVLQEECNEAEPMDVLQEECNEAELICLARRMQ
jgi:hypothetical protein